MNVQELEALADPLRKDVSSVRKKIDCVNKELKSLSHTCQKKVITLALGLCGLKFELILDFSILLNLYIEPNGSIPVTRCRRGSTKRPLRHLTRRTRRKYSSLPS